MQDYLKKVFRIEQNELVVVLSLCFLLMCNAIAMNISDVVSVSGFLDQVPTSRIVIVWAVNMVIVLFATALQSLVIDRFNRISLLQGALLAFIMAYLVLRVMFFFDTLGWLNYSLLYILSEQQWLFFPLLFWVLANDIFDLSQAKRLFPFIAAWGFVGQLIGLGIGYLAPRFVGQLGISTSELLTLNVFLYLLSYILTLFSLSKQETRKVQQKPEPVRETLTEGWHFVREVASFRYLTFVILAVSAASVAIEYLFLVSADTQYPTADEFQTFYSLVYIMITIVAFAIQGFVTSKLIDKLSLKKIFFGYPIMLVIGAVLLFGVSGIIGATLGFALPYLTKETIDESARKTFLSLVPEERRGRVSIFIDSYLLAIGILFGCFVTGILIWSVDYLNYMIFSPSLIFIVSIAIFALIGLWCAWQMYKVYDNSLLNWRLKRRQRRSDILQQLDF